MLTPVVAQSVGRLMVGLFCPIVSDEEKSYVT